MAKKKRPPARSANRPTARSKDRPQNLGPFGMLIQENPDLAKWANEIRRNDTNQSPAQPNSPFAAAEHSRPIAPPQPRATPKRAPQPRPPQRTPKCTTEVPRESTDRSKKPLRLVTGQAAVDAVTKSLANVRFAIEEAASLDGTDKILACIARGSKLFREQTCPDPDGYNVGFDFGSSSSKIIFHQPYRGDGRDTFPLSVPEGLRATGDPFCWQTAVWYAPDTQRFSLTPKPGAIKLTGFKSAIVLKQGHHMADPGGKAINVTFLDAAIAYLALMLAYTAGNYEENRYFGFQSPPRYRAFFLGHPKALGVTTGFEDQFAAAFHAAFSLVQDADRLRLDDIKAARELALQQKGFPNDKEESAYYARTELEGLIAGYAATKDAREGAHLVIDVGATTLDLAFVRFVNEDGARHGIIYSTAVETLGSQAYEWFKALEPNADDQLFRAAVTHVLTIADVAARDCDRAFNRTLAQGEPVPRILCGGGIHCPTHRTLFTYKGADKHWASPARMPIPTLSIETTESYDPGRLLVAWGLARDFADFPTLRLATAEDRLARPRGHYTDAFVGTEQT
ncbi:hypothetical protein [Maricaulis sp.]|uniref:hypothetical protein n=1 Tax=Maricaulis sp. TaxID=1486257 RepID=UPI003A951C17